MRAVALLPAASGNIGKYGAGFLYLNGWDTRGVDAAYLTAAHLKPESAQTISHMDLASRLEDPATKAIVTWNNNIAVSSPEQKRLRRALERDDLLQVTLDYFRPTPPTMPTMCFPPRASSSSTTYSCPISMPASRHK